MKSRALLVFVLVLSLTLVPTLQMALAASSTTTTTSSTTSSTTTSTGSSSKPYSQTLNIWVAGSSDYWLAKLSPINATKPGILAAESVSGVSAYELTAVKTSAASASAQLFWGDGYRVLKLPFLPDSGMFLNVTANSAAAATQAASGFDQYIGADFEQISSSGGNYTFFSPGDFSLAGEIIYATTVPAAQRGLASISSQFSLAADPSPTAILTGVRSGSSFTHSISFGSVQTNGVAANSSITLAKSLNLSNDSILSAPSPGSTQVNIHVLDGLISSKDSATISNHNNNFSSSYAYAVPPSTRFRPNVTLLQDPPVLTATRLVSSGSAIQGGLVSVTVLLSNTAKAGTISNIKLNDSWWNAYPSLFSLSAGTSSINVPSLTAGQNASEVYVLKVNAATSEDFTVPAATVSYSYSAGGSGNVTISSVTKTNEIEVRTNNSGPAMAITATSDVKSGTPVGTAAHYLVTVTNSGTAPALNIAVGNFTDETLVQGSSTSFNTTVALTSLVSRNFTKSFTLTWKAPDGTPGTLVSNPDRVTLSHNGVLLPLMEFSYASSLSPGLLASGKANATYTLTNSGTASADKASVSMSFAPGLTCVSVVKGNATCQTTSMSLTTGSVATGNNVIGQLAMSFGTDNYVSDPGTVTTSYMGLTLHTYGSGYILPAGVTVQRIDTPNPVFQGQNDTVTLKVINTGTKPVYNMSVSTQPDGWDRAVSGSLFKLYPAVNASSSDSFNYTVGVVTPGNHTTSAVAIGYAFGGSAASYSIYPNNVLVYRGVQVTTATKPSTPTEGSSFALAVSVFNPSQAQVSNVVVSIPIPQGLTVVNSSSGIQVQGHTLHLTLPTLAGGVTSTHYIALKSAADGSFPITGGSLTFQYLGDTIQGVVSAPTITVSVDLLIRYELPIGLAVVLAVLIAVYMHRKLSAPEPK